jgi:hypothetical protein
MRSWLMFGWLVALCACGDGVAPPVDAGVDLSAQLCQLDTPTCTNETCGAPCDATKEQSCTDHACFEGLFCQCVVDHWICSRAGHSCDMAVPGGPNDLAVSD